MRAGMKSLFRVVAILVAGFVIYAFGFSEIEELRIASFQASGRVFDNVTKAPLETVEVVMIFHEPDPDDPAFLDTCLNMDRLRWNRLPELADAEAEDDDSGHVSVGVSRADGKYLSRGEVKYSLRYFWLFGLNSPDRQPIKRAWLVYRVAGYEDLVLEIDISDWKTAQADWAGVVNRVPDAFMDSGN